MWLSLVLLVLVLGQTSSQWLSYGRGPNSEKSWMPNMPSPRGGPRSHGRFQTPAPTLRPPVPPPASPALTRQRAMPQNQGFSLSNTVGYSSDGLRGPNPPHNRNFAGQHQNFANNNRNQNQNQNQNGGKVPLPPQPRAPAPAQQQVWRNGQQQQPHQQQPQQPHQQQPQQQQQQQQQYHGARDQKTDSSSTHQVSMYGQVSGSGNRALNWQAPPNPHISTQNQNQNNNRGTGQAQPNSREPRPVSQQPGQLHDSWPNTNTHHHLAPVGQQQHKIGRPAGPTPAPTQSTWPAKVRLSNSQLQMRQEEPKKQQQQVSVSQADVARSHLSAQQKEKIIQMTNTLTKLSPKKPINVFMRQEGIAATTSQPSSWLPRT